MAGFDITLTLDPDPSTFAKGTKRLRRRLKDFRGVFRQISPIVASEHLRGFKSQGRTFGDGWDRIKDITATRARKAGTRNRSGRTRRRRKGRAAMILTGALRRHIGSKTKSRVQLTRSVLQMGINLTKFKPGGQSPVFYPLVQQFGTNSGGRGRNAKVPARALIGKTSHMERVFKKTADRHIAQVIASEDLTRG